MTFRAVLAGCGKMARGWTDAIARPELAGRVELVGLVDVDLAAAERLRDEAGLDGIVTGTDLAAVLEATKPDFVFDVVIPGARRNVVETALLQGCHVLSEKPMAIAYEDALALEKLARETGRIFAVMQNRRYVEGVRRMRAMVDSGALGELTALHVDFFIGAHFGGFREQMRNILMVDMAIHTFDAARFVAGRDAVAVYCHETNPAGSWYAHGAAADAIFELEDGVTFNYRGSWVAEGAPTSWDSSWRVVGSRGTLLWDGADHFEAKVVEGGTGLVRPGTPVPVPPADPRQTQEHASVIAAFVAACEQGTAPETVASDNLKSIAMVFGAIESAKRGARLALSEL